MGQAVGGGAGNVQPAATVSNRGGKALRVKGGGGRNPLAAAAARARCCWSRPQPQQAAGITQRPSNNHRRTAESTGTESGVSIWHKARQPAATAKAPALGKAGRIISKQGAFGVRERNGPQVAAGR